MFNENIFINTEINRNIVKFIGALSFALLTGFGSFIRFHIPFTPVPVTMQVLFVLLAGAFLGKYYGSLSQIIYLGMGMAGVGWFANPMAIFGITGGYLMGFILAPYIVGLLIEKNVMLSMVAGMGVIYLLGAIQFYFITSLPLAKVLMLTVAPFILIDMVKAFVAAGIFKLFHVSHAIL